MPKILQAHKGQRILHIISLEVDPELVREDRMGSNQEVDEGVLGKLVDLTVPFSSQPWIISLELPDISSVTTSLVFESCEEFLLRSRLKKPGAMREEISYAP